MSRENGHFVAVGKYQCGHLWGSYEEVDDDYFDKMQELTCQKCLNKMPDEHRKAYRVKEFFKRNSLAEIYCSKQGSPPCPEQYQQVLDFSPDDRDVGCWSGFAAIGDSFGGKTVSSYHKLKLLTEQGYDCLAITSFDLNEIPNISKLGLSKFRQLTDPWREAEVLLIDDLDKVNVTPPIATHLWNLFEYRLRLGSDGSLTTLVTMNVTTEKNFVQLFSINKGKANDITSTGVSLYNRFCEHLKFIKFKK